MNFFSSVFSAPAEEDGEEPRQEGEQEPAAQESGGGWIFGSLIDTLKEEIEEQRKVNESAAAAEAEEAHSGAEGEAGPGGGWIFGGLIKTLAEEIEAQRKEQEAIAAAAAAAAAEEEEELERGAEADAAAADEEGESSGGGWSFGGLIKTLAEEFEAQRNEHEAAAAAEEDGERGTDAEPAVADGEEGDQAGEGSDGGWSLGGLVKTFASRSESVLGGYRRDLEDLGSGLRLETAALRAAAARAASALPGALEAGASAASDRLESVGQAVDELGAAAAGLLSHANEALRSAEADGDDGDSAPRSSDASASGASWRASLPTKKYTRFEAQVLALRADPATFTEEPEDSEGFGRWSASFSIDDMKEQIEAVLHESPGLESFVERLVPSVVDYETFWSRYFFAVDKLKQAEDVRTKLVSRAMSKEEDEELSWDVDDDDDEDADTSDHKEGTNSMVDKKEEQTVEPVNCETEGSQKQEAAVENDSAEDKEVVVLAAAKDGNGESSVEALTSKTSDGTGREEKTEAGDSSKGVGFSVVAQPSVQEEDLSWEEIEDIGDEDEKNGPSQRSSSVSKVEDLRKRLNSVEDDDEDLSWDVDE
ncbi:BSD domain-containing protein 1 isoform X2 [Sorghum bicolor]|uniref:BSD domain-containing protein 1 isoform X2 n=1 Tax=Sorghum bicolor TaxID=4558 RepID=UPI000B4258B8|nr:BSD domain-containing protein 1 isoform X2 [Sorghum bicolor]|eukprot:XP_021312939.1 BSD domain-containing protein 1 isoform X2 [Sorghum bicolor]